MKDPACTDTRYVVDLVAPGVVNTMPEATIRAVADHGDVPDDSIRAGYASAERVLADVAAVGIDYDDVMRTLEMDGLEKFEASWDALGDELARTPSARRE